MTHSYLNFRTRFLPVPSHGIQVLLLELRPVPSHALQMTSLPSGTSWGETLGGGFFNAFGRVVSTSRPVNFASEQDGL